MVAGMNDPAPQFRDAVEDWLKRTGMAPARLGAEALGDPSFVLRLRRGRVPRLDTADRVLAFIGGATVGPSFRAEIEAFIEITRTKPYVLGLDGAGDPSFVARLRRGVSPRLDTVGRVRAWMAARSSPAERAAIRAALAGVSCPDAFGRDSVRVQPSRPGTTARADHRCAGLDSLAARGRTPRRAETGEALA